MGWGCLRVDRVLQTGLLEESGVCFYRWGRHTSGITKGVPYPTLRRLVVLGKDSEGAWESLFLDATSVSTWPSNCRPHLTPSYLPRGLVPRHSVRVLRACNTSREVESPSVSPECCACCVVGMEDTKETERTVPRDSVTGDSPYPSAANRVRLTTDTGGTRVCRRGGSRRPRSNPVCPRTDTTRYSFQ